jgi:hypothetical protein
LALLLIIIWLFQKFKKTDEEKAYEELEKQYEEMQELKKQNEQLQAQMYQEAYKAIH